MKLTRVLRYEEIECCKCEEDAVWRDVKGYSYCEEHAPNDSKQSNTVLTTKPNDYLKASRGW